MICGAVAPVRRDRADLDWCRVDLRVEIDPQRQLVRKPAVERGAAPGVRPEKVDLVQAIDGGADQRSEDRDRDQGLGQAPGPPASRRDGRGPLPAPRRLAGSGLRNSPRSQPRLLRGRADQGRVLLGLGRLLRALHPKGNHGDVVSASGLVRLPNQARDGVVEALGLRQRGRDPLLTDHRRQPIRAEQVDVAGPRPVGHRVHLYLALRPQRPSDDRALGMILSLLIGQTALAAELLDQRVVGGQELQLAVAIHVRAAVADVGEAHLVVLQQGGRQGCPHPGTRRVGLGEAVDAGVRRPGDRSQVGLRGFLAATDRLERLGRQPRGDLAGLRAAHAVRDCEERLASKVRILVRVALTPRVRAIGLLDDAQHQTPGTSSSKRNSVSPIRSSSRSLSFASPSRRPPLRNVPLVEFMSST